MLNGAGAEFLRRLEELLRILNSSSGAIGAGEVAARGESDGVSRSQSAGAVLEVLLVQGDCLVEPARFPVGAGERATRGEGVGAVGTQNADEVGEVLLKQGDGLVQSASIPVGAGEAVA